MRYVFLGILALALVVNLEFAYRALSTPLSSSVSFGLTNPKGLGVSTPAYFTSWTKQFLGVGSLLLSLVWLRLILATIRKPNKKGTKEFDKNVPLT